MIIYNQSNYNKQTSTAKELVNYITPGNQVLLKSYSEVYYFLCKYNSVNFKEIGYLFPNLMPLNNYINMADIGSYLIISEKDFQQVKTRNDLKFIQKLSINKQVPSIIIQKCN